MFLRFRAYLLSYLMLTCIGAYSQESLKQWFDEAKQFDLNYLNHVHALAQAKQNQQLAIGKSLPHLSFSGQWDDIDYGQHYERHVGSASITETLSIQHFKQQQSATIKSQEANLSLDLAEQDLILRLLHRYFQSLYQANALKVSESAKLFWRQMYQTDATKFEQGISRKLDMLRSQSAYQQAIVNHQQNKHQNLMAKLELEQIVGRGIQHLIPVSQIDHWVAIQEVPHYKDAAIMLASSASIQRLTMNAESAKHLWEAQQSARLPYLTTSISYQDTQYHGNKPTSLSNNHGHTGQVNIAFPLISGGKTTAATTIAKDQYDQAVDAANHQHLALSQQLKQLYSARDLDTAMIEALETNIASSNEALSHAQASYEAGIDGLTIVLDTRQKLDQAKLDLLGAKLNFIESTLKIKALLNQLDHETLSDYEPS